MGCLCMYRGSRLWLPFLPSCLLGPEELASTWDRRHHDSGDDSGSERVADTRLQLLLCHHKVANYLFFEL
jgi:hypothetical protein